MPKNVFLITFKAFIYHKYVLKKESKKEKEEKNIRSGIFFG
jgi:hypothetical protein